MARAVEDSVNVQSFASDREEDTIWKTICENASDVAVATNDAKTIPDYLWLDRALAISHRLILHQGLARALHTTRQHQQHLRPPARGR
jgi:hypothetical protein